MAEPHTASAQIVPPAAPCNAISGGGTTITCSGNLQPGVQLNNGAGPYTTLNVNNLNQNIAPGGGVAGIYFRSDNALVIDSDTTNGPGGPFEIISADAGIYVRSNTGTVDITHTGDITSVGRGIQALSLAGSTNVTSTGRITSTNDRGISASAVNGNATVISTGDVNASTEGLVANSTSGAASVTSIGNVTGGNDGIRAVGDQGVTVNSTGNTTGTFSDGIFASSSGGNVSVTSVGDATGNTYGIRTAGNQGVNVNSTGNVTSTVSAGILATSTNGNVGITSAGDVTGGTEGFLASSTSGTASVTSIGNVTGSNYGMLVQGDQAVSVTTSGGTVNGGSDGIVANSTGAGATVNNLLGGTVTGGLFAIRGSGATGLTINNAGTVTGNVLLGGGANAVNNQGGGLFNTGATVNLQAGNLLTNDGDVSPGGIGTIQTTVLTGNMVQNGGGLFTVDADLGGGTSDLVNISGTANLAGNVVAQIINPANVAQQTTILTAAGGTTNNGLGLITSPAVQAQLLFPNANDVDLAITGINFLAPGVNLNPNQTSVANNLNAIIGAGGGAVGPVLLALLNGTLSVPDYIDGLNQLIPEGYLNTEAAGLFAAEKFNNNLLSCPQGGQGFTAVSQGQCMWLRYGGRWSDRDSTRQNIGYEEDAHGFSGGGQVAVAPNWFVGIAAAYETSDLDTNSNASADTDRYMLGGVIKYQSGPAVLALAGSFGTGEVDMTRRLNFGGFNATARSSFDVDHVGTTFHAAYLMDRSSWYAKPFVDVNVTHIDRDGAQETGGGAANLNVSGSDETYFSVTPALELGTTIDRGDGRAIRPYVRAGVTFYGDADQSLTASFVGAPAGVGAFTTRSEFDDVFADIEAGVTLFNGDQHTVSAGYEGRFSDETQVHGFFVKGTRTF